MTAVEFLENAISEARLNNEIYGIKISKEFIPNIIEKAKEMEKQQIIDAWTDAKYCNTIGNEINYEDGEQYYNETFNKNE
jgi:HEPN domain-containing protein